MSNFVSIPPDVSVIFSFISNVFVNIREYETKIIYISESDHKVKVQCLRIDLIAD